MSKNARSRARKSFGPKTAGKTAIPRQSWPLARLTARTLDYKYGFMSTLQGKTLFITGASRGIGKAIGLRAAKDGANVVIAAKTGEPHAKLPGTIYSAAEEIEKAGGKAL